MKKQKNTVLSLPRALFTLALTSALQSRYLTLVFLIIKGSSNRITIETYRVFFHHIEIITFIIGMKFYFLVFIDV